jgi:hypothetical protein
MCGNGLTKNIANADGTTRMLDKVEHDMSFCLNTGATSAGIVARDAEGNVLLTERRTLKILRITGRSKAEACLEGVRLTVEWIRKPTCVETKCSNLVRALKKKIKDKSSWSGILTEIQLVG